MVTGSALQERTHRAAQWTVLYVGTESVESAKPSQAAHRTVPQPAAMGSVKEGRQRRVARLIVAIAAMGSAGITNDLIPVQVIASRDVEMASVPWERPVRPVRWIVASAAAMVCVKLRWGNPPVHARWIVAVVLGVAQGPPVGWGTAIRTAAWTERRVEAVLH